MRYDYATGVEDRSRTEYDRSRGPSRACASAADTKRAAMERQAITLAQLDAAASAGRHACFHCRAITEPLSLAAHDASSAEERRCAECGNESALPVMQAVEEGWLKVRS